jgi:hypothetical protein
VDQVRLHVGAEHRLVEARLPRRRAADAEQRSLRSRHALLLSDLDDAVLGARNRALDKQQVVLRVDRVHRQPDLVARLAPIWPAIFMPFITRDGVADDPTEPRLRMLCEPCCHRPAAEVVALDRPGEALADRDPGDLDRVARLEHRRP